MNKGVVKALAAGCTAIVLLAGCASGPRLFPEETLAQQAALQFTEYKSQAKVSNDPKYTQRVQRIGSRIAAVAAADLPPIAEWEFVVFEDATLNAFAMPGGKVGVHTGLMDLIEDDAELAAVIGHEVAHVAERHANERMSAELLRGVAGVAVAYGASRQDEVDPALIMAVYGIGSQLGVILPYSRAHEYEADARGLIYAARAGYDPRAAISFWEKMAAAGGGQPPQFLSTHPSHGNRIERLNELMPMALAEYKP